MSAPRIRGFLRAPSPGELAEVAAAEHLQMAGAELEMYAEVLSGVLSQLDRIDELVAPSRPLRHQHRDPGRRPAEGEDPYNAFIRFCRVEGSGDGPLAGMRAAVKDNLAVAGVPL